MAERVRYRRTDENHKIEYRTSRSKPGVAQARKKLNLRLVIDEIDRPFFIIVMVLLVFGIAMMFSASYVWGLHDFNDGYYYARKQIFSAIAGLAIMFVVSFNDYHFFQNTKIAYLSFLVIYGLTFVTTFVGTSVAGARRWIVIGGFNFQPSELLKVVYIIIFAYIMSVNYPKFKDWRYSLLPFVTIMGMCFGVLVLQRHISAVMIFGIIGISLMFISGMPHKIFWSFVGACAIGAALLLAFKMFTGGGFSYISDRIRSWKDPKSDILNTTLQTYQGLLAIGSGGVFGLGFGESRQKHLWLPESQNDFVFAVICEELGFVGAIVVILLFALFIFRGFYIAAKAPDRFGMLLAAGITIQIGLQALLNIMVACNAFPNTGISLPFFSYGGTALLIQLAEVGILLSISRQGNTEE